MLVKFSSPGFLFLWPSWPTSLPLPALRGSGNRVTAIPSLPKEIVISGFGSGPGLQVVKDQVWGGGTMWEWRREPTAGDLIVREAVACS